MVESHSFLFAVVPLKIFLNLHRSTVKYSLFFKFFFHMFFYTIKIFIPPFQKKFLRKLSLRLIVHLGALKRNSQHEGKPIHPLLSAQQARISKQPIHFPNYCFAPLLCLFRSSREIMPRNSRPSKVRYKYPRRLLPLPS